MRDKNILNRFYYGVLIIFTFLLITGNLGIIPALTGILMSVAGMAGIHLDGQRNTDNS